ncbi:hypothetical protein FHW67_001503 [Herbaspirillum sp. Sphag1AN]|uniref:DUF3429 domain-containing protein n=1 Tax=unclassified Herbaspirillum TaxID=2624150 RepID=UPI00160E454A|nr:MULTISPECIES: DUF3429 domain-containing protein [unclassified Herbaspirillum]MBB3212223.1 hypothetical protein [Herbaspirillum sp. Sphag1AN]MBB3245679.1 hypothetical protein [Herbaspirillum sp. Sphag64]
MSNEPKQHALLPAQVLGLGGLIPFVGLPLLVWAMPAHSGLLLHALVLYGAVICTFVGALQWAYAIQGPVQVPWLQLGWSVLPSLVAWFAALLPALFALRLLALLLVACFLADRYFARWVPLPSWFMRLRALLTTVGSAALLVASALC